MKKNLFIAIILIVLSLFSLLLFYFLHSRTSSPPLVFVILAHVRTEKDQTLWQRAYHSIREFYPQTPIVIIDDNSKIPLLNKPLENVKIIRSEYPGAGEILPYLYFLKYRWGEKMVFLHDSMLLRRPFYPSELSSPVKFHWYFEYHQFDDDVMINSLLSQINDSKELIDYNMKKKHLWHGCFGGASIIDLSLLEKIEKKYAFTESLKRIIKTRDQRCAFERVLGLLCFKEKYLNINSCANFGSIRYYPQAFHDIDENQFRQIKTHYPGAIMKTWHGR